jgi:hypothetical protein
MAQCECWVTHAGTAAETGHGKPSGGGHCKARTVLDSSACRLPCLAFAPVQGQQDHKNVLSRFTRPSRVAGAVGSPTMPTPQPAHDSIPQGLPPAHDSIPQGLAGQPSAE